MHSRGWATDNLTNPLFMPVTPALPPEVAVERVLSRTKELAVLPQVVFKIMEMTGSDSTSANALERAIVVDPGFSARILAQANSAYFALPKQVKSIREAVMFLGFKSVRQLAMTVGVFDLFLGKTDRESMRRRTWWRVSIDTAACARLIAQETHRGDPEVAYTGGLLHLIGKTLIDRHAPGEYTKVEVVVDKGADDLNVERSTFGCDHVQVTREACIRWGFPEILSRAVDYRTPPTENEIVMPERACVAVGRLTGTMAVRGCLSEAATNERARASWALEALSIDDDALEPLVDRSTEAIAAAAKLSF